MRVFHTAVTTVVEVGRRSRALEEGEGGHDEEERHRTQVEEEAESGRIGKARANEGIR